MGNISEMFIDFIVLIAKIKVKVIIQSKLKVKVVIECAVKVKVVIECEVKCLPQLIPVSDSFSSLPA